MKKSLFIICLIVCCLSYALSFNERMIADNFIVYTNGKVATSTPVSDGTFKKVVLPTNNKYLGSPACYIACYSHSADNSVYSPADGIYVIGQIRVPGSYVQRNCVPLGMTRQDISRNHSLTELCGKTYESCANGRCWAGGETGGWLGIIVR